MILLPKLRNLLLFIEGFEFELKCVDGWHRKRVKNEKTLNYNRLMQLMSDKRIRLINN